MRADLVTGGLLALVALLPLAGPVESGGPVSAPALSASHRGEPDPEIPGLGADEVADLRAGHGMGLARVAEVQGYPGPRHVLDAWAAGQLSLSTDQVHRIRGIHHAMAAEARRLGGLVVDAERELGLAFRRGAVDAPGLQERVDRIATLRGALRAEHLRAHLRTRAVLDPAQIARYAELRGPAPASGPPGHGHRAQ